MNTNEVVAASANGKESNCCKTLEPRNELELQMMAEEVG